MEPCRHQDPEPGFLEYVKQRAHEAGALLIFDEITIGFRLHYAGAHLKFGVDPDIAIYAKALGNGHPIGAIVGTREAMKGAHGSFISSTYWTEGVGPTAALATLNKLEGLDAPAHAKRIGTIVQKHWRESGEKYQLPIAVEDGYPCLAHFAFEHEKPRHLAALYTQLMLKRGFLANPSIYVTMAHTDEIVGMYGEAIDEVFREMADFLEKGSLDDIEPIEDGFRRIVT
jgi:glutamate-1-semialdehyde 2,1-aminomutase